LFTENVLFELIVSVSIMGPVLKEKLEGDDAEGVVVDGEVVVETQNDLWGHIG
jgi:hypothetical protein